MIYPSNFLNPIDLFMVHCTTFIFAMFINSGLAGPRIPLHKTKAEFYLYHVKLKYYKLYETFAGYTGWYDWLRCSIF